MDYKDMCEQAYRNGYEQGKKDAVRHGKWIKYNDFDSYYCSVCKEENMYAYDEIREKFIDLYCPHCGAEIDLK